MYSLIPEKKLKDYDVRFSKSATKVALAEPIGREPENPPSHSIGNKAPLGEKPKVAAQIAQLPVVAKKGNDFGCVVGVLLVLFCIGAIGVVSMAGISGGVTGSGASYAGSSSSIHRVVYKVTTNRNWGSCYWFDTTYEMQSGTAQKSVSICDSATTTVVDQRTGSAGDFVYLSVQNDEQAARISCQIYIDGKVVYQTWSNGQYVIASCSGSIE